MRWRDWDVIIEDLEAIKNDLKHGTVDDSTLAFAEKVTAFIKELTSMNKPK